MSMSRKDFVNLANEIGTAVGRYGCDSRQSANADVVDIIDGVKAACRAANPAFDSATFDAHLWDVATGRRDREGRKVKVTA